MPLGGQAVSRGSLILAHCATRPALPAPREPPGFPTTEHESQNVVVWCPSRASQHSQGFCTSILSKSSKGTEWL